MGSNKMNIEKKIFGLVTFSILLMFMYVGSVSAALTDNLVTYWSFNSSEEFIDLVNSNYNLTNYATDKGAGIINDSRYGDGSDEYLQASSPITEIYTTNQISFSLWGKQPSSMTDSSSMISQRNLGEPVFYFYIYDNVPDWGKFKVWNTSGVSCNLILDTSVNDNTWHHYAGVYDGSMCYLYVDGELNQSVAHSGDIRNPTGEQFFIGRNWNYAPQDIDGYIDEVGIWDRALTPTEIAELYNSGAGLQYPFITSLTFSNWNVTSDSGCTAWNSDRTKTCNTTSPVPTITFDTSLNTICRIGITDSNYTLLNANRNCTTTGGTSHECQLINEDHLINGASNIYVSCNESINSTSTSGPLAINLNLTGTECNSFLTGLPCNITSGNLELVDNLIFNISMNDISLKNNTGLNLNGSTLNYTTYGKCENGDCAGMGSTPYNAFVNSNGTINITNGNIIVTAWGTLFTYSAETNIDRLKINNINYTHLNYSTSGLGAEISAKEYIYIQDSNINFTNSAENFIDSYYYNTSIFINNSIFDSNATYTLSDGFIYIWGGDTIVNTTIYNSKLYGRSINSMYLIYDVSFTDKDMYLDIQNNKNIPTLSSDQYISYKFINNTINGTTHDLSNQFSTNASNLLFENNTLYGTTFDYKISSFVNKSIIFNNIINTNSMTLQGDDNFNMIGNNITITDGSYRTTLYNPIITYNNFYYDNLAYFTDGNDILFSGNHHNFTNILNCADTNNNGICDNWIDTSAGWELQGYKSPISNRIFDCEPTLSRIRQDTVIPITWGNSSNDRYYCNIGNHNFKLLKDNITLIYNENETTINIFNNTIFNLNTSIIKSNSSGGLFTTTSEKNNLTIYNGIINKTNGYILQDDINNILVHNLTLYLHNASFITGPYYSNPYNLSLYDIISEQSNSSLFIDISDNIFGNLIIKNISSISTGANINLLNINATTSIINNNLVGFKTIILPSNLFNKTISNNIISINESGGTGYVSLDCINTNTSEISFNNFINWISSQSSIYLDRCNITELNITHNNFYKQTTNDFIYGTVSENFVAGNYYNFTTPCIDTNSDYICDNSVLVGGTGAGIDWVNDTLAYTVPNGWTLLAVLSNISINPTYPESNNNLYCSFSINSTDPINVSLYWYNKSHSNNYKINNNYYGLIENLTTETYNISSINTNVIYPGNIKVSTIVTTFNDPELVNDTDFSTYGYQTTPGETTIYFNYSTLTTNLIFEGKDNRFGLFNYTIPIDGINNNKVQIRAKIVIIGPVVNTESIEWAYWNSTLSNWQTFKIGSVSYPSANGRRIYETKMYDIYKSYVDQQLDNYSSWICEAQTTDLKINSSAVSVYPLENLTIYSPDNNTITNESLNVLFNVIDLNEGIECNLNVNNSYYVGKNISSGINSTIEYNLTSNGYYEWNVSCNAQTQSIESDNYIFTYDANKPTYTDIYTLSNTTKPTIYNNSITVYGTGLADTDSDTFRLYVCNINTTTDYGELPCTGSNYLCSSSLSTDSSQQCNFVGNQTIGTNTGYGYICDQYNTCSTAEAISWVLTTNLTITNASMYPEYPLDNTTLRCIFNVSAPSINLNNELNVSITWYSSDDNITFNHNDTYDYIFENVTKNHLIITDDNNGSVTGNLGNNTHWNCEVSLTNSYEIVKENSTQISVYPIHSLTLYSPDNNTISNEKLLANFSVVDLDDNTNCSLYTYNATNTTLIFRNSTNTVSKENTTLLYSTSYSDELFKWLIICNDTKNSQFIQSEGRDYIYYNSPPEITDAADNSSVFYPEAGSTMEIFANVSSVAIVDVCNLYINLTNSSYYLNQTLDVNSVDKKISYNLTIPENQSIKRENASWYISCNDTVNNIANSSIVNFTIKDFTEPEIIYGYNNGFALDNTTVMSAELYDLIINVTFADPNLFQASINVSCSIDGDIYYYENLSIPTNILNVYNITDLSSYKPQKCQIDIQASDDHTDLKIDKYKTDKYDDRLSFVTEYNTEVEVISLDNNDINDMSVDREIDRYKFNVEYKNKKVNRYFKITSNNTLYYIENSNYPAHFVAWNSKIKAGNWIDFFESQYSSNREYIIEKISDYEYDITISSKIPNDVKLKDKKDGLFGILGEPLDEDKLKDEYYGIESFEFESIGGTLINNQTYIFNIGGLINISTWNLITNSTFNYTLINSCDATTGWTASGADTDTETVNDTIKIEGTGSLNTGKSGTTLSYYTYTYSLSSVDYEFRTINGFVYINNTDTLNNLSNVQFKLRTSSGNYYLYTFDDSELSTGWNYLYKSLENYDSITGSPDIKNLDEFHIIFNTKHINSTISFGNTKFDWIYISDGPITLQINKTYTAINLTPLSSETVILPNITSGIENISIGNYTFRFTNNHFFGKTYIIDNENISQNITYRSHQTQVNIQAKNIKTNEFLTNLNITIVNNKTGVAYHAFFNDSVTTTSSFLLDAGIYNLTVERAGYIPYNNTFVVTFLENITIPEQLSFVATFYLYDERTLELFNVTGPDAMTFLLFCPNETRTFELNTTNETQTNGSILIDCNYTKFKLRLDYGAESYFRTFILEPDEALNFNIYLIDLLTTTDIQVNFILDDLLSSYESPSIYIKKIINDSLVQITADYTDVENKIIAYLIQNHEYIMEVHSANNPVRIMGSYGANEAGDKTIRLYDINLNEGNDVLGIDNVDSYTSKEERIYELDNGTNITETWLVHFYNDTENETSISVWTVYEESYSHELFSIPQTAQEYYIEYNVTGYENITLLSTIEINHTSGNYVWNTILNEAANIRLKILNISYIDQTFINWAIILLLGLLAIMATKSSSNIISFAILGIGAFFVVIGWSSIPGGIIALGTLIAIISFFTTRKGY